MKDQEIIDYGWEDYSRELEKGEEYVDVGILEYDGDQAVHEGDITLAELANIQEFGTEIIVADRMRAFLAYSGLPLKQETVVITIPARPFMRQTFDENESKLSRMVELLDKMVLAKKMTRSQMMNQIGQTHKQQIQKAMSTKGKFRANHPYTVGKKGSSQPLIDTGILRQAIDYEVG